MYTEINTEYEDYEECGIGELLARMRQEKHRLADEATRAGDERGRSRLEKEMSDLRAQWGGALSTMPLNEAQALLISHLREIEGLHAHTEWGVGRAILVMKGLQGALAYVAAHLEALEDESSAEGPAPAPAPTEEEDDDDDDEEDENSLKARMARAVYRLWDEGYLPAHDRNNSLEEELTTFRGELEERMDDMPSHESHFWLESNLGAIERLHARTEKERNHALLVLVGLRGSLAYTANHLARSDEGSNETTTTGAPAVPSWDEAETMVAEAHAAHADDDDDDDDEEDDGEDEGGFCAPAVREIVAAYRLTAMSQRDLLLARLRQACARLGAEAACFASWDPNERALNARLGQFQARAIFCLRGICPLDAQTWLDANVGEIEGAHARTRDEYEQAGLILSGVEDRLFGLLYDLAREK